MGKYLEIYAEVYDGDVWKATGYRKEKKFPYQRSYQLEPIYNQRDWNYLHELLAGSIVFNCRTTNENKIDACAIRNSLYPAYSPRLFPKDTSDEILAHFFLYSNDILDENHDEYTSKKIRQIVIQQGNGNEHGVGWLTLEELNNFDWWSNNFLYYSEVQRQKSALLDDSKPSRIDICFYFILYAAYNPLHGKAPFTGRPFVNEYQRVSWISTHTESAAKGAAHSFYTETLPLLRTYGDPKNVRIIFWGTY